MKADLKEYGVGFVIELIAEDIDEAAAITRFGLNSAKDCYYKASFVGKEKDEHKFSMTVAIRSKKKLTHEIK